MKQALALVVLPLTMACGGEAKSEPPPQSALDAAAAPPAAATPPADTAASEPAGNDEAWSGEAEAKAEKVPPGAEGKTETRTMEVIANVVKENRQPVRDCMDKVQKQLPDLEGDMVIHFVIDPAGKVRKAELNLERSSLKNAEVAECAVKTLLSLKFPPSSRQMETEVNYPYNFKRK